MQALLVWRRDKHDASSSRVLGRSLEASLGPPEGRVPLVELSPDALGR